MTKRVRNQPGMFRSVTTVLLSLLLAGNIYFIKRLIDQIDEMQNTIWQLRQTVSILETQVNIMNKQNNK